MKNSMLPTAVSSIALSIALFGSGQGAFAQQPNPYAQQQPNLSQEQGAKRTRLIRVNNVSPTIMAWWLDPTHNTEPVQFQTSRAVAEGVLPVSENDPAKPMGDYKLPDGIEKLVPIDPQNALLVAGTTTDFSEIEKTIASLDKPLKQVEIQVQFLQIGEAEVAKLGLKNFSKASEKDPYSWAVLTPDSELKHNQESAHLGFIQSSTVTRLIEKSKARIITAPRVTALDNLNASLRSETARPFILGPESGIPTYTEPDAQCTLYWNSGLGITVRPTVNKDDTINMALAPGLTLKLQVQAKDASKTNPKSQHGLETVWQRQLGGIVNLPNIKSGQTIAVMGLKSDSLLPREPGDKSKPTNVLLLVTAQTVRRAANIGG